MQAKLISYIVLRSVNIMIERKLQFSFLDFILGNRYILINNMGDARMKVRYSYVCRISGVGGGKLGVTGLKTTNLAKSKFVSVVNDKLAISESQFKAILRDTIFEVGCRKEYSFFR
ncbi:hypothetical protein AVEN_223836-1 [Araneus ventricosus]|uniref:Uncharacterized protein n=1 Tax=Araneus ventricosus TaxID=182803 RepID=A0A4Y2FEY8_ARAVE|nr:hypothetical protein AVEN_223836-1 [Araneus ventricosus]